MRVPVQTSFGLALLPLPVTVEARSRARVGTSERAREEAFYQGFPERRGREPALGGLVYPTSSKRFLCESKVLAGLVSLAKQFSRRVSSLRWPARKAAPSHRG